MINLQHIGSCSDLVTMIESLEHPVKWLEIDLHPDQMWGVPADRVRTQDLLHSSVRSCAY